MPYSFREDLAAPEPQAGGQRAGKPSGKGVGMDLLDEPPSEAPTAGTVAHWIVWLVVAGLAILVLVALLLFA